VTLHYSEGGYAVTRSFEGRSLKAYRDEVGVWTIGFGNTNADASVLGFEIKAGVTINEVQAEQLLRAAISSRYEPSVRAHMGASCSQHAYDAGVDFDYNTGAIARASWVKSFVANNLPAVHSQILQWNKAGGNVLAGLTRRRIREWEMIDTGDYGPEGRSRLLTDEKGRPIAGATSPASPSPATATPTATPPVAAPQLTAWHQRMESILGLYEFPGNADNPCILAMAQQCGGAIARNYKHDAMAWCALTVNWCLITTGHKGSGTLWALDMRKATTRLDGPAVGAIATKTRDNGGHTFIVKGRTPDGRLVGTGGNQADMVCDETFDPHVCMYGWPDDAPPPAAVGFQSLPIVEVRPHTHKAFSALPGELHPAIQNANPTFDGAGMLKNGDNGQEVKDAKVLLIAAGYKLDPNNDKFGPLMEKAVRDFQHRHPQLEETGILDPATRASLKRDASMKGKIGKTLKTGATGGSGTGVTDAATGGHIPWELYAVGGVVLVAVLAYFAWHYRDELRAMFTGSKA
jgi:uncharacterized protein (TIGR02594 family)